jgi:ribosomal protein S15P/S13E
MKLKSKQEKPVWLKYSEEEVKALILKLADKNLSAEKIGLVLRDSYGIPKVSLYGLKIKSVLKDKFTEPTVISLEKKVQKLDSHTQKNKQDKKALRSLIINKAKLKKRHDYHNR